MSKKSIYELGLHESIAIDSGTSVARVPGGWIYTWIAPDASLVTSNFVPWHNEYQVSDMAVPEIEPPEFEYSILAPEPAKIDTTALTEAMKKCTGFDGKPCGDENCPICFGIPF